MNEQELRDKIIGIVLDVSITGIKIREVLGGEAAANSIADALISVGIGDVSELQKECDSKEELYNKCYLDYKYWKDRAKEYEYRAEVAEKGKMISKYDIEYMGVKCTEVEWNEPIYTIFHFVKDGKTYNFVSKKHYDCSADTDHIRCVIEEEFLPYWKDEHIKQLETKNDELKARLDKVVELKVKVGDTIYLPWQYDGVYGIATLHITSITILGTGVFYTTDFDCGDDYIYSAKYKNGVYLNTDFGVIVFTNRTEAEKELQWEDKE